MKKLDKLIIKSFTGPFFLTFVVVVFILLTQYMLKYFDDFVGKDLGMNVFAELILYFSINMTPVALPLAVLLSSLMTFGNLGENFELTAIKGAGISLTRSLQPLFFLVVFISILAFLSNNYVVPRAALKAYSLLYDIKQKKPALDIQEGVFYGGIPNYKIKVNKKYPDGETLKDIMIYDHTNGLGNRDIILADSGKMYTINNDRYLMLELFDGNRYSESQLPGGRSTHDDGQFIRNNFDATKIVFSLASFDLQRTKEEYFASHRRMKTLEQLNNDIDSLSNEALAVKYDAFISSPNFYSHHLKYDSLMPEKIVEDIRALPIHDTLTLDSAYNSPNAPSSEIRNDLYSSTATLPGVVRRMKIQENRMQMLAKNQAVKEKYKVEEVDSSLIAKVDSAAAKATHSSIVAKALTQSRTIKNTLQVNVQKLDRLESEINKDEYEGKKKIAQAVSCLIMFLIGAPLGAIIKRGGLGLPVLISICFFITFYVLTEMTRKWAEDMILNADFAVWFPNLVLLPFGIVFLVQARLDTRLLEMDFYLIFIDKVRKRLAFFNRKLPV